MDENTTYSWKADQPKPPKKKPDFKRAGRTALVFAIAAILVLLAGTCFYTGSN